MMELLRVWVPILFKVCPWGKKHPRIHQLCRCREGIHENAWHGGVYDFKTGLELVPYVAPRLPRTAWDD